MTITWYTLKWNDDREESWGGCMVEHFPNRAIAERREKEVAQISTFVQSYGITENKVKSKRELLEWLDNFYDKENG